MFKFFLFKTGQILASLCPLKLAYRIASILSDFKYKFFSNDIEAVKDNLRAIGENEDDLEFLSQEMFRNFSKYLVDFFRMPSFTREFVEEHVKVENQYRLDEALAKGKGVIIMTAHVGNWELGGLVLGRLGYPLTAVALPHKEPKVNELFNRQRAEGGVTVTPISTAIRRCLHTLKNNGIVALLADRDFSATGEAMSFFGKDTMIPRGLAMFAYRTGAVTLPMFLTRAGDGEFKIFIDEPLQYPENFETMEEKEFTFDYMKQQVDVLEKQIKSDPAQWLLFRRFWIDKEIGPERITST